MNPTLAKTTAFLNAPLQFTAAEMHENYAMACEQFWQCCSDKCSSAAQVKDLLDIKVAAANAETAATKLEELKKLTIQINSKK